MSIPNGSRLGTACPTFQFCRVSRMGRLRDSGLLLGTRATHGFIKRVSTKPPSNSISAWYRTCITPPRPPGGRLWVWWHRLGEGKEGRVTPRTHEIDGLRTYR